MTDQAASFRPLDWGVLGGYFLLLLVSGVYLARRRQRGTEDYFLGGRRMPVWAVALSVVATTLSAATFIGAPQQAYVGDLSYLSASIGGLLAVLLVAGVFIPVFYRHRVATVYELLGVRYGQRAKLAASWTFMIGRVFASGARVFIAALPGSLIFFGDIRPAHLLVAVAVVVVVGTVYTIVGGIASVIWTDVIQTIVFLLAAGGTIILLLNKIPIGLGEIVQTLQTAGEGQASKLTVFRLGLDLSGPGLGFDPSQAYTILTAVLGFSLLNLAAYGTDHDLAQRMLTCRSAARGSWSAISAILIGIPITLLFMVIGLLLYIFYARPDVMGAAAPSYPVHDTRQIFLLFILREMLPGTCGLMMAGLFAAALSSLNSALNAMSSTFVNDFYRSFRPGRREAHYLRIGRLGVAAWGLVLGVFAVICVFWQRGSGQTLIDFALGVMTFAYAGLLAVFLAALFTGRGSNASVIAALITGFVVVFLLQPPVWARFAAWMPAALAGLELAYPWRLLVGTVLALLVCCLGSSRRRRVAGDA